MSSNPANIFDLLAEDRVVDIPTLPVSKLVRLDTPCLYAIHDNGLVGSSECLYVGKTDRPFERIYEHFASRNKEFWSRATEDKDAHTESAEGSGGSNYLYDNILLTVKPVDQPEILNDLETAAISRLGPRYNERDRISGGYSALSPEQKQLINELLAEPLVEAKVGGTYSLIATEPIGDEISRGDPLKVGRTGNLISRLTDHIRNTTRPSCLRWKVENEFPNLNISAPTFRSRMAVSFTPTVEAESDWERFFGPRYPEN